MASINMQRVLLGGAVAAAVMAATEFLRVYALAAYRERVVELGVAWPTGGQTVLAAGSLLLGGIVAVWLYAAIRPRYGPGPVTALRAGLALWVAVSFIPTMALAYLGVWSATVGVTTALWSLATIPLALMLGAWVYAEEDPVMVTRRQEFIGA
jgi:hypothetical protein